MKRIILAAALTSTLSLAECPKIDPTKKDTDGMPFCPVLGPNSAWDVYSCAIEQGHSFHAPTAPEKASMKDLLTTFKTVTEKGIAAETTTKLLAAATSLNLQTCRVVQTKDGARDSFLLFYVKPGVKDYSGPFMMLRETKHSNVIIVGPHDDSDNTYASTKLGTQDSFALGTISNGHKRGNTPDAPGGKRGDFVHEALANNLGTFAIDQLGNLFKGYVVLHVHGMADPSKVLVRSRDDKLKAIYEQAIKDNTNITEFSPLNADFTIEPYVNTNLYLKTEVPVRIHANNKGFLAKAVKAIEAQPWAWDKK